MVKRKASSPSSTFNLGGQRKFFEQFYFFNYNAVKFLKPNFSKQMFSSTPMLLSYIEGYMIPIVTLFGLIGNLVTAYILQSPSLDMKTSFRHILLMLAAFDAIFSFLAALTFSMPLLSTHWNVWIHPFLLPWLLPGMQIALNGSIWSTVIIAIERYLSVRHPSQR